MNGKLKWDRRLFDLPIVMRNAGYYPVSRDTLRQIPLPEAGDRPRWKGVPHHEVLELVESEFAERGYKIDSQTFVVSRFGQRLDAHFTIAEPSFECPKGILPRMTLVNSHDSSVAVRILGGAVVAICTNGMTAYRETTFGRKKHTLLVDLELPGRIKRGFDSFEIAAAKVKPDVERLEATSLTEVEASHLILESARREIVPWAKVQLVDRHWQRPGHENLQVPERNAWRLYNAFSFLHRDLPPRREVNANLRVRNLILGTGVAT